MKLLLVYPPFCTPASPPYSLVKLAAFLKANSEIDLEILDLNLRFHGLKWKGWQEYFHNFTLKDYGEKAKEFLKLTADVYAENNRKVVNGKNPELLNQLVKEIKDQKADYVAFSVVYSSQAFYTLALLKKLKNTIIGGPAVNEKLIKATTHYPKNEVELLELLGGKVEYDKLKGDNMLEFGNLKNYFVKTPVIPIRTASTCYYQQCTFCSHHQSKPYQEFDLKTVQETIKKAKQVFLIDDMITKNRLLELAKLFKPLKIKWMCQLKPKEWDRKSLQILSDSGLKAVIWGVESGCQRILDLMKKGTKMEEIAQVLKDSKAAGIKNGIYIMWGFPTETEAEIKQTINFLQENKESIDLISTSAFGLQKGTPIYQHPEQFRITKVIEEKRTVLEPKISYEISEGLNQEEVVKLKRKYQRVIEQLNHYPKEMNFFREHWLNVCT